MTVRRLDVEEHVEPTRRGQVLALSVFALGITFALALLLLWPPLMAHVRSLPVCDQLRWYGALVTVQALLMAVMPLLLLWAGLATRRSDRWPPPRMVVLRRTRVLRGAAATRRARWLIGAGVATAIAFALLVVKLLTLVADLTARWQCGV
jgi:hypothetical protein